MPRAMSSVKVRRPIWSFDHAGVDAAFGERCHGADEVAALADDPGGADDVVAGGGADGGVAGGFGLPVDAERADRVGPRV